VFLPGLASRNLPLPLGGSSNHFRTRVLHNVGAWDAYNVTEDADLGIRLARFGYRTTMIGSTTYEEAPITAGAWLRQRTRWFKGWMQTWLVHSRRPLRLLDQLGPAGFIVFQLVVAGSVLAALVHPIFLIAFARQIMDGSFIPTGDDVTTLLLDAVHGTTLTAGYLVSGLLGALGLVRRRLFASTGWLLLIPLYWLLLSLAAWRALFQLLHDPCSWEKTEHGLARSSRLADRRRQ
jgi:cellulose synthase/poly-beta-1,6-N-acetylglucosamine synthase-like glycosyltransferase